MRPPPYVQPGSSGPQSRLPSDIRKSDSAPLLTPVSEVRASPRATTRVQRNPETSRKFLGWKPVLPVVPEEAEDDEKEHSIKRTWQDAQHFKRFDAAECQSFCPNQPTFPSWKNLALAPSTSSNRNEGFDLWGRFPVGISSYDDRGITLPQESRTIWPLDVFLSSYGCYGPFDIGRLYDKVPFSDSGLIDDACYLDILPPRQLDYITLHESARAADMHFRRVWKRWGERRTPKERKSRAGKRALAQMARHQAARVIAFQNEVNDIMSPGCGMYPRYRKFTMADFDAWLIAHATEEEKWSSLYPKSVSHCAADQL